MPLQACNEQLMRLPRLIILTILLVSHGICVGQTTRTIRLDSIYPAGEVRTRSHDNFVVDYARGDEGWVTEVISRVDAARRIVGRQARDSVLFRIHVVLAPKKSDFIKLAGGWAENSAAIARGSTQEILINGDAIRTQSAASLEPILVHEFAHLYLDLKCQGPVPRWLHEGIAQHVAGEWTLDDAIQVFMARVMGKLIPLSRLEQSFPTDADRQRLAYKQSYSLVDFLAKELPGETISEFIASIRGAEGRTQLALYSSPVFRDSVEYRWRKSLKTPWNWALVFLSSGLFWGAAIILTFLAWYVRKRRSRKLHNEWDEEERVYQVLDEEEEKVWKEHDEEALDPRNYTDEEDEPWKQHHER